MGENDSVYIFLGLKKIKEKQEFYYYSESERVKIDYKAEGGNCRLSLDSIDSLDFFQHNLFWEAWTGEGEER